MVNPNKRAAKKVRDWAALQGHNLEQHRSRLVTVEDMQWADIVLYMDNGNQKRLMENFPQFQQRLDRLSNYATADCTRIPDPNYLARDSKEFTQALELLQQCCETFIDEKFQLI